MLLQGYGPKLRQKPGLRTFVVLMGVGTCILHLTFPVISGLLLMVSGPELQSALDAMTDTAVEQARRVDAGGLSVLVRVSWGVAGGVCWATIVGDSPFALLQCI